MRRNSVGKGNQRAKETSEQREKDVAGEREA